MPDGSNATLTGLVVVDVSDAGYDETAAATADAILISTCRAAVATVERIVRATNGDVVRDGETPTKSHERLATSLDYLLADIAYTPASTAEGLRAKAEVARRFGDNRILWSIADDVCGREGAPPTPAALTPDPIADADELFDRYDSWLFHERRTLLVERHGAAKLREAERFVPCDRHVGRSPSKASDRAAAVLGAAGVFIGPENHMSPAQLVAQRSIGEVA